MKRGRCLILITKICFLIMFMIINNEVYAERFFKQNNTWYEPVPANPIINENSNNYVDDILINSNVLTPNQNWSSTVWKASANDPVVDVIPFNCAVYGGDYCKPDYSCWQKRGWDKVPLPANAKPAMNEKGISCWPNYCHDGMMVIISPDGKYSWDFGRAYRFPSDYPDAKLRGKLVTKYLRRYDLSGTGVLYPFEGECGGPTFAKVPLLHGLITYNEYLAGEIDHALAFAYHGAMKKPHWTVYPSNTYSAGVSDRTWAMKGGERLYLDSSVDCEAIEDKFAKLVCKALKKYGMIFRENDGIGYNSIYVENTDGKPYSWKGIITHSLYEIPLNKLRVVEPICSDCSVCPNCVSAPPSDTVPPAPPTIIKIE